MNTDFKWDDKLAQEFAEQYRFSSSRISIEQFKESKRIKPLITTEDGIYYYAGQRRDIYCIPKQGMYAYKIDVHPEYYIELSKFYDVFFSTKEAAEEYVLCNKACLSLSEVLTRYNCVGGKDRTFAATLRQLAKIKQ